MNGNSISLLSYLHSTHSCSQQSSRRFGLILLGLLVVGCFINKVMVEPTTTWEFESELEMIDQS